MKSLVTFLLCAACALAHAQNSEPLAADLREEIRPLPVTVKDMFGREETKPITLTLFRPSGDGPFPLLILNHGRAVAEKRANQGRQRYEPISRYFVSKGFAVIVPTRMGYHETYGDFDPEASGPCNAVRPQAAAQASSDQVLATLEFAKTLPWVDTSRWVVAGQSAGGNATVAIVGRNPPGLVAAINFAGGANGNPDTRPGNPCGAPAIASMWKGFAASSKLPMLWLYWQNDRFWGPDLPVQWAQAWRDGGGELEFHQLPAAGTDGHAGSSIDMDHWVPLVEAYLAKAGFSRSGLVPRPPATAFAAVAEADKLPASQAVRDGLYQRFLAAKPPRAFALGPGGAAGFSSGDWAMGRALGFCQARRGQPCKLYAVDDDVVWVP